MEPTQVTCYNCLEKRPPLLTAIPLQHNGLFYTGLKIVCDKKQERYKGSIAENIDIWDIHTHILPGIDDGARDWSVSVEMIRKSWEAGVRHLIATPHFLPWQDNVSAEVITGLCGEAMERARKELGISMEILPGQEIYYHVDLLKELSDRKVLTLAGGNCVLVEFSEDCTIQELLSAAESFRRSPFRMIAAHCERYAVLRKRENLISFMKADVMLQSNIEVIAPGLFHPEKRWLKQRYASRDISYIASDMHNLTDRPPISEKSLGWFRKHLKADYFEKLLSGNPGQIPLH